ncbi:hypothetical protein LP420_19870 [Massilia sp. B-10]|nr:hypothetical protein LP420_19870 [Massilia sp. B-10]
MVRHPVLLRRHPVLSRVRQFGRLYVAIRVQQPQSAEPRARLVAKSPTGASSNKQRIYEYAYRYQVGAASFEGISFDTDSGDVEGSPVTVLYLARSGNVAPGRHGTGAVRPACRPADRDFSRDRPGDADVRPQALPASAPPGAERRTDDRTGGQESSDQHQNQRPDRLQGVFPVPLRRRQAARSLRFHP